MTTDTGLRGLQVRPPSPLETPPSEIRAVVDRLDRLIEVIGDQATQTDVAMLAPRVFPANGGVQAIPAGTTTFDYKTGRVLLPDGNTLSLPTLTEWPGESHFYSVQLLVDTTVDVSFTSTRHGASGFMRIIGPITNTWNMPFDEIRVLADVPYNIQIVAMTRETASGGNDLISLNQRRYGTQVSTDSWESVVFRATGQGVQQASYGRSTLHVEGLGSRTFYLENTGSNDILARVQVRGIAEVDGSITPSWFVDPDTAEAILVESGQQALIESSFPATDNRLQISSRVAGSSGTLVAQFIGNTQARG